MLHRIRCNNCGCAQHRFLFPNCNAALPSHCLTCVTCRSWPSFSYKTVQSDDAVCGNSYSIPRLVGLYDSGRFFEMVMISFESPALWSLHIIWLLWGWTRGEQSGEGKKKGGVVFACQSSRAEREDDEVRPGLGSRGLPWLSQDSSFTWGGVLDCKLLVYAELCLWNKTRLFFTW